MLLCRADGGSWEPGPHLVVDVAREEDDALPQEVVEQVHKRLRWVQEGSGSVGCLQQQHKPGARSSRGASLCSLAIDAAAAHTAASACVRCGGMCGRTVGRGGCGLQQQAAASGEAAARAHLVVAAADRDVGRDDRRPPLCVQGRQPAAEAWLERAGGVRGGLQAAMGCRSPHPFVVPPCSVAAPAAVPRCQRRRHRLLLLLPLLRAPERAAGARGAPAAARARRGAAQGGSRPHAALHCVRRSMARRHRPQGRWDAAGCTAGEPGALGGAGETGRGG